MISGDAARRDRLYRVLIGLINQAMAIGGLFPTNQVVFIPNRKS
jgi:hypothetical protein